MEFTEKTKTLNAATAAFNALIKNVLLSNVSNDVPVAIALQYTMRDAGDAVVLHLPLLLHPFIFLCLVFFQRSLRTSVTLLRKEARATPVFFVVPHLEPSRRTRLMDVCWAM